MIQICQILSKTIFVLNCIGVALLLVAFECVGINHQKGGDWKGNVPLGNFYYVLVFKCPTHLIEYLSANQREGMFLDLVVGFCILIYLSKW